MATPGADALPCIAEAWSAYSGDRARWWQIAGHHWPELAFVAGLSLYLGLCVDMRLVFWNQNDLFLWHPDYFRAFFSTLGGPSAWLGKLVLQAGQAGWPGAVTVATLAGTVLLAARVIWSQVTPVSASHPCWMMTAVLLGVVHSQYGYGLTTAVELTLVLLGTAIYVRVRSGASLVRWSWFASLTLVLFYLAGRAGWTLVACSVIYELCVAGRRRLACLLVATAAAAVVAARVLVSYLPPSESHLPVLGSSFLIPRVSDAWLRAGLLVYFPLCLLVLLVVRRPIACRLRRPRLVCGVVVALAGLLILRFSTAAETRQLLAIDLAAHNAQWKTVLYEAGKSVRPAAYADFVNQDVNLALYHLGRLPDDMFTFPQVRLFCEHGFGGRGRIFSRKAFDLLLELGRVSEAEVIAHNDFEGHPSALFLMRIARTKMIKGQSEAARLYLNVLRDDLTYGGWAAECLEHLEQQATWCEPAVEQVKSRMLTDDDAHRTQVRLPDGSWSVSAAQTLLSLLECNPKNRMAFEYLMALYLLQRDHAAVVRELPRLRAFGYPRTPRLYEEAALLHVGNQRERPPMTAAGAVVNGCLIRRDTMARFLHLVDIDQTYRGFANPAAQSAILNELGGTYFAYVFCGSDPDHD
ncbi:MAG: DUF6057 family protein [Pirellulaceae bacterium]|nr:DUF6057 family protein [Pirellulaceae bacterium]